MAREGLCKQAPWVALMILGLVPGCGAYERAKQIRTHANLQAIAGYLKEEARTTKGGLSAASVESAIGRVAGGRDQWGQKFQYALRETSEVTHFLLISTGADRKLDLPSVEHYFDETKEIIAGKYERDIVFLDGVPLKGAGK